MNKKVRLSEEEIKAIKETAEEIFGKKTKVYLFGSRADPNRKGGDIDLYIVPEDRSNLFDKELQFLTKLKIKLGDQKIDVVIQEDENRSIEREARRTGIEL